jgi:division/cell wall cluster transcriptional repressor MraZ
MAENQTEPIFFGNTYRHGIDAKRRVQVPSKWRPQSGGKFFVMVWDHPLAGKHLRVLPVEEMIRLRNEINRKVEEDPKKNVLKRILGSGMDSVELDSAGRICLAAEMAKDAEIAPEQQVVLVGAFSYFEIWSKDRYEKVGAADDALRSEALNMVG